MANITDDAKSLARTTLQALLRVQLPAERWQAIKEQLCHLQDALEQDDGDAFREARTRLGELRHLRIGQIGNTSQTPSPPPESTREFINRMVHALAPHEGNPPSDEQKDAPKQSNKGQ